MGIAANSIEIVWLSIPGLMTFKFKMSTEVIVIDRRTYAKNIIW